MVTKGKGVSYDIELGTHVYWIDVIGFEIRKHDHKEDHGEEQDGGEGDGSQEDDDIHHLGREGKGD